jgi:DNA-binding NarL/FixJ family response regulator
VKPTRVLLVEDHQVVREGLRALVRGESDLELVGEAEDGDQALQLAAEHTPDVVVLDVGLPGLGGIEAARRLRKAHPETEVVMLSMHDDASTVDRALRAGAKAYVLKGRGFQSLCEAIRAVRRGETWLSPDVSNYVLPGYLGNPEAAPLSDREREVLVLIAEGLRGSEIALRLGLKPKTVENHRARIMDKLHIHTTAGLVRYALTRGIAR